MTASSNQTITVLIVDDSLVARELLRDILEEGGYAVIGEAADGIEAVEKYRKLRPMVTIMDVKMPRMGGVDASREILAQDAEARILICSATERQSLISAAADAGACGFVTKPFILENIVEAIQAVILLQQK